MPELRAGTPSAERSSRDTRHPAKGPTFFSLVFHSPLSLVILCGLTFMATLLLLEGTERAFWGSREVWLWHFLFAFQPVLYVASIAASTKNLKPGEHSVWPDWNGGRLAALLCTGLAGVMGALPPVFMFATRSTLPANLDVITQLPDTAMKLLFLGALGTGVSALHCFNLFGAHIQLIDWLSEEPGTDVDADLRKREEDVLRYLRLRAQLKRSLGFITAIISVAILHAGAFNSLLNKASAAPAKPIPVSFVMAYGAYFTGLLACAYLPAYTTLTKVGEALAHRLVQQSISARVTWKDWFEELQAVRIYLGLQVSALQEFQQGFAVLTPFLASLSSLAIGAGG